MTTPPNPFANVPPPSSLRVVVADDNPVVRAGLTALLTGREDITVVAEAADGREAYEAARTHRPDVVLLDVRMPGVDGISALPYLVRIAPVVMLTYSRESEIVQEALRRGAGGYLVHGDLLRISVYDDGTGLPPGTDLEQLRRAGHFGLVGMVERAASVGARIRIGRGAHTQGTEVRLELPLAAVTTPTEATP